MILDEFLIKLGVVSDTKKLEEFRQGLGKIKSVATVVVASVTGLTAGITTFFGAALSAANELDELAEKSGTTSEYIQGLSYAAEMAGSSTEAARASVAGLGATLEDAASGAGAGAQALAKYGLSAKNADGSTKSLSQVLSDVQSKMSAMSRSKQVEMLSALGIDRSMVELLSKGQDGLHGLMVEAERLGVVTAIGGDAAAEFTKSTTQLGMVLGALRTNIAIGLAPAINNLVGGFRDWLVANRDLIRDGISAIAKWIMLVFSAIKNFITAIHRIVDATLGWKLTLIALGAALMWVKRASIVAFATNPVFLIIGAIAGLIVLIDDLITYLDGGESALDWSPILPVIEAIQSAFRFLKDLALAFWEAYGETVTRVLDAVWSFFKATFDFIVNAFRFAIDAMCAFWRKFGDNIKAIFKAAFDVVQGVIDVAINVFKLFCALLTGDMEGVKDAFSGIWEGIKAMFSGAIEIMKNIFAIFGEFLMATLTVIGDFFAFVWEGITFPFRLAMDIIKALWDNTFGWIMSGIEKIKGVLGWIGEKLGITSKQAVDAANNAVAATNSAGNTIANTAATAGASPAIPVNQTANVKNEVNNKSTVTATINVSGAGDPKAVADATASSLKREQQRGIANAGGHLS